MAQSAVPVKRDGGTLRWWIRVPRLLLRPHFLFAGVVGFVIAAEVGVRALDASRGYSAHARTAWYWLFEQDPFLGYRGRPRASAWIAPKGLPLNSDRIQHNGDGFRDDRTFDQIRRLKDKRLVVCVGDGNTYGLTSGGNDHTYPAALERELRGLSGDEGWTVFNAGVPGYTTHEILELIKLRLLKLQPDVIVLMSLPNDFEQVTMYLDQALDYDYYPLRMAPLSTNRVNDFLMRSALLGRLAQRWRDRFADDLGGRYPMTAYGEATERGMKLYFDNVALAAVLCARSKVALMLVDPPMHYSACSYGATQIESVERMRKELRRIADETGVPLLAAHTGFDWEGVQVRGDLLLASNESVLGRTGYERLAKLLAPQVLKEYAAWDSRRGPEDADRRRAAAD